MTQLTTPDPKLNWVIQQQVEGPLPDERVVFIDIDNNVREVVYPHGYDLLPLIRARLEGEGVLKAVLHIAISVDSSSQGHGERTSMIEYLPEKENYSIRYTPPYVSWSPPTEVDQRLVRARNQQIFGTDEGKEDQET